MKRITIVVLCVVLILGVCMLDQIGNPEPLCEDPDPIYPKLIVKETEINDPHVYIVDRAGKPFASLPLATILENLNIPVLWENSETARFAVSGKEYILSLSDRMLYEEDNGTKCLIKGVGLANIFLLHVYKDRQDLYLDNYALSNTLERIGIPIVINWDAEKNEIVVTEGQGSGNLTRYRAED